MRSRLSDEALAFFRQQGAKGGKKAAALSTPAERKARAIKAAKASVLARSHKKRDTTT